MEPEQIWTATYVSVLSMRLHPRNQEPLDFARIAARTAAEAALRDYKERFICPPHG